MNRGLVIGCPGSGKSTFARALHQATGIPLFHLDMMYWNADRTTVDPSVFHDRLKSALQNEAWIIDGNYASTMELRMQACDTIVFLDYPQEICLAGIRERRGKVRPDMPWVEPENEEDEEFIDFIQNFRTQSRPKIMHLLARFGEKDIHIFENRGQADVFLRQAERITDAMSG